jgi:hypothetical protein
MAFATTRPSGEAVELLLPVEDPGLSEISGKPETLTGDVDLRNVIRDLSVLHKSNVVLLWPIKPPVALHLTSWKGGFVIILQQK